jgi:hypothetical protein
MIEVFGFLNTRKMVWVDESYRLTVVEKILQEIILPAQGNFGRIEGLLIDR